MNIANFDQREYQSVVIAAFLHDIGKLLHRESRKTYWESHEKAALEFFVGNENRLSNDRLYDLALIKYLVSHHHASASTAQIPSAISPNRAARLLGLIRRADSYSCKERDSELTDEDRRKREIRLAPLNSIFSTISIDSKTPLDHQLWTYMLDAPRPMSSFPKQIVEFEEEFIKKWNIKFSSELPEFNKAMTFQAVINLWLNHLAKYCWCVPSDTRYNRSDVSLFDHLRTSAAIAACLYKRHSDILENAHGLQTSSEFIFVGGDFSGIQDYIFDVTNIGTGGSSKRLRARSLFVSMFCEATIHKVLDEIDLPVVCNLFSAGGKFLLLAPNTKEIERQLSKTKAQIQKELLKERFGRFAFLMHWDPIYRYEEEMSIYHFVDAANDMFDKLKAEKVRRFSLALKDDSGKWVTSNFQATRLYDSYGGAGDCKICGKGPATESEGQGGREALQCRSCYQDLNIIGNNVPKCKALAFGKTKDVSLLTKDDVILFRTEPTYFVRLVNSFPVKNPDLFYLIYNIGNWNQSPNDGKVLNRYYANYVPTIEGSIMTFEQIAQPKAPISEPTKSTSRQSSKGMLGILKADVDNLGLLFNKGFEYIKEQGVTSLDRKTISRFLTLSRMMDLFFTGWVKEALSSENRQSLLNNLLEFNEIQSDLWKKYLTAGAGDFSKIYTVYSGGDDLVLIGPWQTMIVFSLLLNSQFRAFTCNNTSITLSAGLAITKPRFPVSAGIELADAYLNQSKENGKGRITLFGRTVKWERLPKLADWFLFFDSKIRDKDSNLNTSFLHRLLNYHSIALESIDHERVIGLRYIAALNYDIWRNIVKKNKKGSIISGEEELLRLQPLLHERPYNKEALISDICIPASWALYRYRESFE